MYCTIVTVPLLLCINPPGRVVYVLYELPTLNTQIIHTILERKFCLVYNQKSSLCNPKNIFGET